MNQKTCFIVGAGSFDGMYIKPEEKDFIIAADGGYTYLKKMGMEPDVLLGDFDSLERVPEHKHLERHSPIKDDTDMALAAAYAREQGCSRFFIYGGLGGRLDHTIGNLQLLIGLSREGAEAYLIGQGNIITAITRERVEFGAEAEGILSVFCMSEPASGVWERGLKYTLTDATLVCDKTLGVSNEFTGQDSFVEVRGGTLVLLWDIKNGLPRKRSCCGEEETKRL
ncbi:MAG: thiamine diphosphokinase [Lachnospiraceae bacterium]|nr:thiamine diphosphokinase [Lachnospiraceae bacterium]